MSEDLITQTSGETKAKNGDCTGMGSRANFKENI